MLFEFNTDSQPIEHYEKTPEGYMKLWTSVAVANQKLHYDDSRVEVIDSDSLFNEASIITAIAKPFTLNHPPLPVNTNNYKKYAVGTTLQEYSKDGDKLVIATFIHDNDVIRRIESGEIKYTSAAYTAKKSLQQDGTYKQEFRHYNHFAGLTSEYNPRAGTGSKILVLDSTKPIPKEENNDTVMDGKTIEERIELWSEWKPLLTESNKTIDYSMDATGIKRLVLSCYYPEKILNQLNDDATLNGFWLNFTAQQHDSKKSEERILTIDQQDSKAINDPREAYIAMLEGKTK